VGEPSTHRGPAREGDPAAHTYRTDVWCGQAFPKQLRRAPPWRHVAGPSLRERVGESKFEWRLASGVQVPPEIERRGTANRLGPSGTTRGATQHVGYCPVRPRATARGRDWTYREAQQALSQPDGRSRQESAVVESDIQSVCLHCETYMTADEKWHGSDQCSR